MFGFSKKKKIRFDLPDKTRLIAIGDIHGQIDRLLALFQELDKYRKKNPVETEQIIFLGDYADRGIGSAEVVDYLCNRKKKARKKGQKEIFLAGNHEELLLKCLDDDLGRADLWWRNGGKETVQSYANFCGFDFDPDNPKKMFKKLRENFPEAHAKFYRKLENLHRAGPFVFVHAGIRMDAALKDQKIEDLRWIRAPFLNWKGPQKKYLVVHGHTITPGFRPEVLKHRIGLDTGSYRTKGKITAGIFEKNQVRFISSGTKKNFKTSSFS